jgi:F0F1-type ATP synthase membrane subunit b/b'
MVEEARRFLEVAKKEAGKIVQEAARAQEQRKKKVEEQKKKKKGGVKKVNKSNQAKHMTVEEKLEAKFGKQVVGLLEKYIEEEVEREVKEELAAWRKNKKHHRRVTKKKDNCH